MNPSNKTSSRYQAIQATRHFPGQSIKHLCILAQVSRVGYYRWLSKPTTKEGQISEQLKALLKQTYWEMKGKWGLSPINNAY